VRCRFQKKNLCGEIYELVVSTRMERKGDSRENLESTVSIEAPHGRAMRSQSS